jgi:hypothetical protein
MAKLSDVIGKDTEGNKPAAGMAGRLYFNVTTGLWQRDTGSTWEDCVPGSVAPEQVAVMTNATTNATPTELFTDGVSAKLAITSGYLALFDILVVGAGAAATVNAAYRLTGAVKNVAGTTTLVGSVITTEVNESEEALAAVVTASGATGKLILTVTGKSGTAMNWSAVVRMSAVALAS